MKNKIFFSVFAALSLYVPHSYSLEINFNEEACKIRCDDHSKEQAKEVNSIQPTEAAHFHFMHQVLSQLEICHKYCKGMRNIPNFGETAIPAQAREAIDASYEAIVEAARRKKTDVNRLVEVVQKAERGFKKELTE